VTSPWPAIRITHRSGDPQARCPRRRRRDPSSACPFTDPLARAGDPGPPVARASCRAKYEEDACLGARIPRRRRRHPARADWAITIRSTFTGVEALLADAKTAGVDGLIVSTLPPKRMRNCACRRFMPALTSSACHRHTTDDKGSRAVLANTVGLAISLHHRHSPAGRA